MPVPLPGMNLKPSQSWLSRKSAATDQSLPRRFFLFSSLFFFPSSVPRPQVYFLLFVFPFVLIILSPKPLERCIDWEMLLVDEWGKTRRLPLCRESEPFPLLHSKRHQVKKRGLEREGKSWIIYINPPKRRYFFCAFFIHPFPLYIFFFFCPWGSRIALDCLFIKFNSERTNKFKISDERRQNRTRKRKESDWIFVLWGEYSSHCSILVSPFFACVWLCVGIEELRRKKWKWLTFSSCPQLGHSTR